MAFPPPPTGWSRYLVKSMFGAGRDLKVLDPVTEAEQYVVDGKLGVRPKAEIRAASGQVVYQVRGRLFGVPKQMTITDASGGESASLKAKMFSPVKSRMTLTVADGPSWELKGSLLEKEYAIAVGGRPVVQITQRWVTVRDTYTLDVADGTDPAFPWPSCARSTGASSGTSRGCRPGPVRPSFRGDGPLAEPRIVCRGLGPPLEYGASTRPQVALARSHAT
jgi:uncharacterized protein YxjI